MNYLNFGFNATLDSRGRITIPKNILTSLGIEPGDKFEFDKELDKFGNIRSKLIKKCK